MLSDDDLDLTDLSDEELDLAWDLWFDLAQSTNDDDPPYTHGVFQRATLSSTPVPPRNAPDATPGFG
jgi:hypothetical protein